MCDHLETFQLSVITFEVMCDKFNVNNPTLRRPVFDPKAVHAELWWTEWHGDWLLFEYFGFRVRVSFHQCCIPSCTHAPPNDAVNASLDKS